MYREITWLLLGGMLVCSSGCGMVAKRAFKEAIGATSTRIEVPGTIKHPLTAYRSVRIEEVETRLGTLVPAEFRVALPRAMRRSLQFKEAAPFDGGDPSLTIDPEVMWYHKPGMIGSVIGSDSYAVVVLFELSDEASELGRVQIVTTSSATRTGHSDLADSMADELAEWFDDRRKRKKRSSRRMEAPTIE